MFIKDMNKSVKNPSSSNDGLALFMKGAPERILSRCSKIQIKGEIRDFDAEARREVNDAND
jgi:magnesium-transporting ATPase (P-type)